MKMDESRMIASKANWKLLPWSSKAVPKTSKPGSVELEGDAYSVPFGVTSAKTGLGKEHIVFMGILATLEVNSRIAFHNH